MLRGLAKFGGGSLKFFVARREVKSNISMWKGGHMNFKKQTLTKHIELMISEPKKYPSKP